MRTSAAILAAGAVLLALAVADARDAAAARAAWFDAGARDGAAEAVARFANLSAHLRSSGGDRRFADRLPADAAVVDELLEDVAFVQHRGCVERAQLVKVEVTAVKPVGSGLAEVQAREFWISRLACAEGPSIRSDVVRVTYATRRDGGSWRVADWTVDPEPDEGPEAR